MSQRVMFLRDYTNPNKHPVGCVAVEIDRAANQIRYALSTCSPKDAWNRKVANHKASGRLIQNPTVIQGAIPESTHAITRRVMEHIVETHSVQGGDRTRSHRAFEAARGWLVELAQNKTNTETHAS